MMADLNKAYPEELEDITKNTIKAGYKSFVKDHGKSFDLTEERLEQLTNRVLFEMGVCKAEDFYHDLAVSGDCFSDAIYHQLEVLSEELAETEMYEKE